MVLNETLKAKTSIFSVKSRKSFDKSDFSKKFRLFWQVENFSTFLCPVNLAGNLGGASLAGKLFILER